MDELGDYIYLIILAIAALSGIFRKKKPAQNVPQPPTMADMEDELQEFLGENKPAPEPVVLKPDIPYHLPVSAIYKTFENTDDVSELRVHKQVEKPKNKHSIVYPDEIEDTLTIELNTVEQARRAFVHSEIFNRKY